jgi:Na+-transporting NADH:ubiquinone oxidoreductase subunit C
MSSNTNATADSGGLIARLRAMPNDTPQKMILFTVALCFVCAVLVSSSHVLLRPLQEHNKALERSSNILQAAGLFKPGIDILDVFQQRVTPKLVNLDTGEYVENQDAATFDQRKATKDPQHSRALSSEEDIAGIRRRANSASVYLVKDTAGQVQTIVLPVNGYGLWSTMYGFLALKADGRTILGLTFYEHGETPGLGAEITNPTWRAKWVGKTIYDSQGRTAIKVIKGQVDPSQPGAEHQVDAIAGATLTSQGVSNLMQFWLGEKGFGRFLARFHKG